jgi:RND family efflux transporter MFP subunit
METTNRDLVQAWLDLQCSMVSGVTRASVFLGSTNASDCQHVASWPAQSTVQASLQAAGQRAIREHRSFLENSAPDAKAGQIFACPVFMDGQLVGAFAVEMVERTEQRQRAALQVFTWGAEWLEIILRSQAAAAESRLHILVEVLAKAVVHDDFQVSAMAVVNVLTDRLDCERVSLSLLHGMELRLVAISKAARLDTRNTFIRKIIDAMHEAVDQNVSIVVPTSVEGALSVSQAHQALRDQTGSGAVATVPLTHNERSVGALTLERQAEQPFDTDTLVFCESLAAIIGPLLAGKLQAQRSLPVKLRAAVRGSLARLFGPGHPVFKTGLALSAGLLLLLALVEGEYRIDAKAGLEGTIQRVVVAPFEGFITEASVRAGDIVEQGQLLCRLDDRDLQLERAKWSSEQAQLLSAQREALAKHDRSEISILKTQFDQAKAELALVEEKLARTRLTAPLSGLVVSGDLSQSLGVPVERGQVLFQVAPLDAYRIMLEVDERDIAQVQPGQRGQLALAGLPNERQVFIIERILPVSTAAEGRNFFRIEARLDQQADQLQPGMRGVGKIETGSRKLIWIWTHRIIDELRLMLWTWSG